MNKYSYIETKQSLIKQIVFTMFFLLLSLTVDMLSAQPVSIKIDKNKSDGVLEKAKSAYDNYKFSIAAHYFEAYLLDYSNLNDFICKELADCYWQMREYDKSLWVYKLLSSAEFLNQHEKVRVAELYARHGQYQEAYSWLNQVVDYKAKAEAYNNTVALNQMKTDSLNWKLGFLNINTSYREFSPFFANNILFFSSNKPLSIETNAFDWDGNNFARLWQIPSANLINIPIAQGNDTTIIIKTTGINKKQIEVYDCGDNKPMKKTTSLFGNKAILNANSETIGTIVKGLSKIHFNAGSVSMDKNNHFYFSSNYSKAGSENTNRICLMEGLYTTQGITSISKLPFGDPNLYSVMHPAVNQDGTILVCSSDKPNGNGGFDLYYSERSDANQQWSPLKTFVNKINTIGNEVFPTISQSGFLYYSSDGKPGLGGLDIYRIPIQDAISGISNPVHLSYPVNSSADDFGWCQIDSTGSKGFFTSDRFNMNDNIYSFTYDPVLTPKIHKNLFIEGYVFEKKSMVPIVGTTIFLYNLQEDSVYIAKTDNKGKYHIPVRNASDIIIKAIDDKYINDCLSTHIILMPQSEDTIVNAPRNLLFDQFKVGFTWKLSNIHYDFNKWNIRADAMPILDSLIMVLNEQPITIELGSHTDSRGSFKYNERLSQHRADAAVAYLIQHGIDSKRITAKGYGEYKLLNKCSDGVPCTDEEQQVNRRTEVKVTGYTTPQKESESIDIVNLKNGDKVSRNLFPKDFFQECR